MVTIIPGFYHCKLIFPLCICQDLIHFFLCKSTVGMPSFRTPPSGLGISTRLTGDGVYFPQ